MVPADWPWLAGHGAPTASAAEVHVWWGSLDLPDERLANLRLTLSTDEQARAARFRFERDRRRYVAGRGQLRQILAAYLQTTPDALAFSYSPYGKPALSPDIAAGLEFNLSHASDIALYAVSRDRRLGIDIEALRPELPLELGSRFFSPPEIEALGKVAEAERPIAFLNCWTRKEAYIKARGEGLSLPLESFDVSLTPGLPAALLDVRGAPDEVGRWSLQALSLAPGYVGALAVEGHGWTMRCWRWQPWTTPSTTQSS